MAKDFSRGTDTFGIGAHATMHEKVGIRGLWVIQRYATHDHYLDDDPYSESEFTNGFVTAGITIIWQLACATASPTAFSNSAAKMFVGTGSTAADPGDAYTDFTDGVNKGMEASYPQVSGGDAVFRSVFGSSDANQVWAEFGIANGATGTLLNRAVSAQGTKASGQVWTATATCTIT